MSSVVRRTPGATAVLTLRHLAHMCNVPYPFLRKIVERDRAIDFYRVFSLKRKNQGLRKRPRFVCVPHPLLMRAQRWIHHNILLYAKPHSASKAYGRDCSILDAAQPHCLATWLIKMDITKFFDAIVENSVQHAFEKLGYQPLISFEMARICTRLRLRGNISKESDKSYSAISKYTNMHLGHLPQGAPTSPVLANLVAHKLDIAISNMAAREEITYTRYADDITLSYRGRKFSRSKAARIIDECYGIMRGMGFFENQTKTRVVPPGSRKIVLGLLVDGVRPRLTPEFKNSMRSHLYYLSKFGPSNHASSRGFDSITGLQNHLYGLAAFAVGVDKKWGRATLKELNSISWPSSFLMPQS